MVLSPQGMKIRLQKLRIEPDKWLGQHFLIDRNVYDQIITTAQSFLSPEDTILEIGSGLGTLTDELIKTDHPVISIEKDPVLARNLVSFLNNPKNLAVIHGDVLKELALNNTLKQLNQWSVVANIPYAISSPLIRKLLYRDNPPYVILVLVQKEMAERIVAKPGSSKRGVLTCECEIMATAQIIQLVPPTAFWPAPSVTSALLCLTLRDQPLIPIEMVPNVLKVVRAGFSGKRKQLANSLAGTLRREKGDIAALMIKLDINPERRAETLSIDEWHRLTVALTPGV